MAAATIPSTQHSDPGFIKYLLNPELKYECYFLVGNETLGIAVERIGVVKKMLYAHSEVLRVELEESQIAEKGNVKVNDLYPDTFRNLLRFVYGFDNTSTLTFNDADNLLYASEKYMITDLKNKVSTHLMSLLNYDNICSLLNNPACYKALELNNAITRILQQETSRVLESPLFLELSSKAFAHILQQEKLLVPEITLWRAALDWAKSKADTEDGPTLRATLTDQLKHIRVCTLEWNEFCTEVVPTNVLTDGEVKVICLYHGTKEKQPLLTEICNEIELRYSAFSKELRANFTNDGVCNSVTEIRFSITNKESEIRLKSLILYSDNNNSRERVTGTVQINGPGLKTNCPTADDEIEIDFNKELDHTSEMVIPLSSTEGELVNLHPGKEYYFEITFHPTRIQSFYYRSSQWKLCNFTVDLYNCSGYGRPYCNLKSIVYCKKL